MLVDSANNDKDPDQKLQELNDAFLKPPASLKGEDGAPVWWHGEDEASNEVAQMFDVSAFIKRESERGE